MTNYSHCKKCGTDCPVSVGWNITVFFCPNCGKEVEEDEY